MPCPWCGTSSSGLFSGPSISSAVPSMSTFSFKRDTTSEKQRSLILNSFSIHRFAVISVFLLWFPGIVTSVAFLILYARGNNTILRWNWFCVSFFWTFSPQTRLVETFCLPIGSSALLSSCTSCPHHRLPHHWQWENVGEGGNVQVLHGLPRPWASVCPEIGHCSAGRHLSKWSLQQVRVLNILCP